MMAYYRLARVAPAGPGVPGELRLVPATAALVAYADVHALMGSEMRRALERVATGQRGTPRRVHEFAGIDFEKDVNHVVAYTQAAAGEITPPGSLMILQG